MDLDKSKISEHVNLVNYEHAEFYRHILICYNGKPVATGSLNITSEPIKIYRDEE